MKKFKNGFVVTMQYNEKDFLPLWVRHYSKYFELQQMYVIDHGSDENYVPAGINRIYVPRTNGFDEYSRRDSVKFIVASLRKFYSFGIYCDCDELIDLNSFDPEDMVRDEVVFVIGFDLFRVMVDGSVRIYGMLHPGLCKPLVFNALCPDWTIGFHGCKTDRIRMPFIKMGHLKFLDLEIFNKTILNRKSVYKQMREDHKTLGIALHWNDEEALKKRHKEFKAALDSGFFRNAVENFNPVWQKIATGEILMKNADPVILDLTDSFPDLLESQTATVR